jgi:hypothetical protein
LLVGVTRAGFARLLVGVIVSAFGGVIVIVSAFGG